MEPLVTTLLDHLPVLVSPDFRAHCVDKVITVTVVIYCDRYNKYIMFQETLFSITALCT